MALAATAYPALRAALLDALRRALGQALPPRPQVARHWEDASRLRWLGLFQAGGRFALSWSFGALKGPPPGPLPHTAGVFVLAEPVFRGVDAGRLQALVQALDAADADGPTRAFLQRVVAQLALAEAGAALARTPEAFPMPLAEGFEVALPLRPDALGSPAPTPRVPAHARERVEAAVASLEPELQAALGHLFTCPEEWLLAAVLARTEGREYRLS